MKAEKDKKTGKWLIQYRYTDWQGNRKKSTKRGFDTKREAEEWLRNFLLQQQANFNMNFEEFLNLYYDDMTPRLRENTMKTKKNIIDLKILPYFKNKSMNDIKPADIRKWQNELLAKGYASTYLKTINNQLTAIFNYATRYHDLKSNPCTQAGSIGTNKANSMDFWTKDEFTIFIDEVMDKHMSYIGFKVLFWTGIRIGELLALTFEDIDFENKMLNISKSYQRLNKQDIITEPKTAKGIRQISIPEFLIEDLSDYKKSIYSPSEKDRLFPITKGYFTAEMKRGIKNSGVKKIRLHDLRHSHCALLFEMGISALEVAERLGHEKIETTLNTYAHLYPNKQKVISEKLEQIYSEEF